MTMTIGEVAARSNVPAATVRYYERRGILSAPLRTPSGYRQYEGDTLDRLRFIKRAQELGFSLEEISELLELRVEDRAACPVVESQARAKLEDVRRRSRELRRMEAVLERLAASCAAREPTDECPILETLLEVENA